MTARSGVWLVVMVVALVLVPVLIGSPFYVNLASQVLIYAILAMSLNLLVGFGGLTSLGHAAYLGFAAYVTIYLTTLAGFGQFSGALIALVATTGLAMLFGFLALRASGLGFLMITLALGQILWGLAFRWVSLTGGDNGLGGMQRPHPFGIDLGDPNAFYYFALCFFLVAFAGIALFVRSPFGHSLRGSRDQPRRMRALGYNVWFVQWCGFVYAGFWGAIAGILYAYYNQFVSPHALNLMTSAETLLMVIAGGAGTLFGPIVGAVLVVVLKNVVSAYIARWVMLLGAVFVMIVLFMPEGLVPGTTRWTKLALGRRRRAAGGGPGEATGTAAVQERSS
ncbi:branched-chain amino acid ABC transporter permease [Pararhizobium mangrovi]|uniref:Branched-chain amino acid ABC transporter permease n=1 Tax=Pararhizobium mangrovi TaxID=2590452 RepID=A0A506U6F2_9HYPH|nr:branched-chain amino acid ABC transporter permease [Pararhizobium mangrovi]TPW28189.1 branched-chain amino acid ABC transporter permease [Pararhizobium mangrovi]